MPGKNLRRIGGVSLVSRAVATALKSSHIDAVYVSSEDKAILAEAVLAGAATHVRSAGASDDGALAAQVVMEFVSDTLDENEYESLLVYLQPTSPLRSTKHIDDVIEMSTLNGGRPVWSLSRKPVFQEKLVSVAANETLEPNMSTSSLTVNRQHCQPLWQPNGAIYAFLVAHFLSRGEFPLEEATPYWMDELEGIDIDSDEDLRIAEAILGARHA